MFCHLLVGERKTELEALAQDGAESFLEGVPSSNLILLSPIPTAGVPKLSSLRNRILEQGLGQ